MKDYIPMYKNNSNDVQRIEDGFKANDRKMIKKFLIFCSGSAGEVAVQKYKRNIVKICDVFEGDLDKIDLDKLRDFLKILNSSELMTPTKNEIKKVLKRFLKENYEDWNTRFKGLRDKSLKTKKEVNLEKINENTIFRKEEIEKLVKKADLKHKVIIMLFYETAGRPEEILKLKWGDINLEEGNVKLHSSKTGNTRINPIQNSIIPLKRYKEEYPFMDRTQSDYLFPSPQNRDKHIHLVGVWKYLKTLGNKVLGREIFPYLFRHTRATELQKVLPAKIYEKFMDHSIETASRYSHLNNDDVREAMFKNVYEVKELTNEEKNQIGELKKEVDMLLKENNALREIDMLELEMLEGKMTQEEFNDKKMELLIKGLRRGK